MIMKLVRYAAVTASILILSTLVFLPGPTASGQTGRPQSIREAIPPGAYPPGALFPNMPNYYPYPMPGFPGAGHDPDMVKLMAAEAAAQREAAGLVKEYGRSEKEEQRDKIKTKLSEVLGKQFDLQQKRRDRELARLEAQVKKLRDLMKKRSDARQTIVDKRLDQLIREAEGLGWTAPPGVGVPNNVEFIPDVSITRPTYSGQKP
jgi:hypothetical protein